MKMQSLAVVTALFVAVPAFAASSGSTSSKTRKTASTTKTSTTANTETTSSTTTTTTTTASNEGSAKSTYTLLNPAPASEMGTMTTERMGPAITPNTMTPGHYSIEMTAVSYGYTKIASGYSMHNVQVAPFNLRAGLIAGTEAHAGINYLHAESTASGTAVPTVMTTASSSSNVGTINLATKTKLVDTSMTPGYELAVMPMLDMALRSAESWNLGVAAPMAFTDIAPNWTFGAQGSLKYVGLGKTGGGSMMFGAAGTIARSFNDKVDVFGGLDSKKLLATGGAWVANLNLGAGYSFTQNFRVDAGTNIGLTTAAEDINPYVGGSVRF